MTSPKLLLQELLQRLWIVDLLEKKRVFSAFWNDLHRTVVLVRSSFVAHTS